jgi:hypothetical protein
MPLAMFNLRSLKPHLQKIDDLGIKLAERLLAAKELPLEYPSY